MIRPFSLLFVILLICFSIVHAEEQSFGGVGLQVVPTINGDLVVLNVLAGSPAAEKGIRPGDLIYRIDNFDLYDSDFGTVVSEYLWGEVGSTMAIHYRRPGIAGSSHVELVRMDIGPRLTVTPSVQDTAVNNESGGKQ